MVFDPSVFTESVEQAAKDAVEAGLNQVAGRARHKAPVRRIFKGSRKIGFKGAVGVQELQLNETKGPAFRYSERAGVSVGATSTGRAFAHPVFRSVERTGVTAGDIRRNRDLSRQTPVERGERLPTRARPNSSRPTIRVEGLGRVTGDFRDLSPAGGLAMGAIYRRVNGHTSRGDLNEALTARGRYEVANVKTRGHLNAKTGEKEVGGALRDSIKVEGPFMGRGEVYGFVSAAAFNEQGFNYAFAQEVGTGHNRPQPFLRPALRELRDRMVKDQQNAFRTAMQNAHGSRRGSKTVRRTLKLKVDFVGFDKVTVGLGPAVAGGD